MTARPDWLTHELIAGIDRFIEAQDVPPNPRLSQDEALAVIVRDWLQGQGYLALPDGETVVPVVTASEVPTE